MIPNTPENQDWAQRHMAAPQAEGGALLPTPLTDNWLPELPLVDGGVRNEAKRLLGIVSRHSDDGGTPATQNASHGCVEVQNALRSMESVIADRNQAREHLAALERQSATLKAERDEAREICNEVCRRTENSVMNAKDAAGIAERYYRSWKAAFSERDALASRCEELEGALREQMAYMEQMDSSVFRWKDSPGEVIRPFPNSIHAYWALAAAIDKARAAAGGEAAMERLTPPSTPSTIPNK